MDFEPGIDKCTTVLERYQRQLRDQAERARILLG